MGFKADPAAITAAAQYVSDSHDDFNRTFAQVREECEATRAHWQGGAQVTFAKLMSHYDDSAKRALEALHAISENIKQNGVGYDNQEQAIQDSLHSAPSVDGLGIPTISA